MVLRLALLQQMLLSRLAHHRVAAYVLSLAPGHLLSRDFTFLVADPKCGSSCENAGVLTQAIGCLVPGTV